MKTVGDLLKSKGSAVWSVPSTASVYKALEVMAEKDVGALLVIEEGKLVGVFSERDYARKVILKGKSSRETTVSELMTRSVYYVKPGNTVGDCMSMMTSQHIRHLPVLDSDNVVGVITIGDVVKAIIQEQEVTIHDLQTYIVGGYK